MCKNNSVFVISGHFIAWIKLLIAIHIATIKTTFIIIPEIFCLGFSIISSL